VSEAHKRRLRFSRDGIMFLLGIAGIIYETIADNGDKPTLLVLFGAMIGLPAFLHADSSLQKDTKPPPLGDKGAPPKEEEVP
jgi:hypothetical protein